MEIRRLLYFARIAEDGSLTKAAGVLRIAQPALSRQLRLLEEELGVSLFTRTARGMRLTEEGEYLRASAAGPLRALELALQNVRSLSSGVHGNLVVGMTTSLGDLLAKPFVLRMNAGFPDIKLRLGEGATGSLIEWLNRGIIDFALLEDATRDDRLADVTLHSEPLVFVGGAGSDLKTGQPISFRAALKFPLIIPSHHLGMRAAINEAAAKSGAAPQVRLEADSTRLMMDLVEHGDGYAMLPSLFIRERCEAGRLKACPLNTPPLPFNVFLSARRREQSSGARIEEVVLNTMRELFVDLA